MLKKSVSAEFKNRRDALMKAHPGSVFIFPSNPQPLRNIDVPYEFRQESNFYYLTGYDEAESYLVLAPSGKSKGDYKTVLFVMKRDPTRELWDGERYGVDGAIRVFGADEAYENTEFAKILPDLLKESERVYYRLGIDKDFDQEVLHLLDQYRQSLGRSGVGLLPMLDPRAPLGEMRLFKSSEEISHMRKAGAASAKAHVEAMKAAQPGVNEFEISALLEFNFKKNGCQRLGYSSIVAGGENATCLHYIRNNEDLKDKELLLIDAGGEYDYYGADITRTFPVGKGFTKEQEEIYSIVLKAQKEAVAMAKPGIGFHDIHDHCVESMTEGLLSLGVLKGKKEDIIKNNGFRAYYPHNTGHWLGMDVHDVGLYKIDGKTRKLEPGMVFTIEPGLYFQTRDSDYPEKYRGIGVRIEDDVLITPEGCEVFSKDVPKEIDEILKLK